MVTLMIIISTLQRKYDNLLQPQALNMLSLLYSYIKVREYVTRQMILEYTFLNTLK